MNQQPSNAMIYGPGGVGKTVTAMLLAVGLSKEKYNGAGITLFDPEHVAEFVQPICDVEGVPLFVEPSRSFIDMRDALPLAIERGCCAFVVDHYDGVFREISEAQKAVLNLQGRQRPYHHREELVRLWDQWVNTYRDSPIHAVFTARQAFDWGDDETDEGDPIKIKLGSKARGDGDANYETNLLVEMERIEKFTRERRSKRKVGQIEHAARVVKDRRMTLNGLSFIWHDLNGYTKPGGYKAVWKALGPHFAPDGRPQTLLRPEGIARSSTSLFSPQTGETRFAERQRRVEIAYGEIDKAIDMLWPSANGTDDKRLRAIVKKMLFGVRSDAAILALLPDALESAARVMAHFESAVADPDQQINPKDEAAVIALLQSCKDLEREHHESAVI